MLLFMADTLSPKNKKKIEILYERYSKKMFAVINKTLNNKSLSEDALQNSFLSIVKHIERINVFDNEGLEGYVIAIAKNEAYNILRNNKPVSDIEEVCEGDVWANAEEKVLLRDEFDKAVSIMREMDDKYRAPLYLYCVMGHSVSEISSLLHRNEKTVKTQIFRAKKILADKLREAGYER
ncbi:MAG: sigma-70 family RNA polymerase sigma factor [Clostridia bacterium]|nr:sigma-70 family RNA polymerase sigma factor [Clostridia bacterium]